MDDSCDSGHEASEINNFGTGAPGLKIHYLQDKDQVETWIHNSIAMHTPTSRELVESFYNEKPSYSYFKGCSTGGAQGFALALFHPYLFDGIISGCAGNWYSHLMLGFLWNTIKSQVCPSKHVTKADTDQAGRWLPASREIRPHLRSRNRQMRSNRRRGRPPNRKPTNMRFRHPLPNLPTRHQRHLILSLTCTNQDRRSHLCRPPKARRYSNLPGLQHQFRVRMAASRNRPLAPLFQLHPPEPRVQRLEIRFYEV